MYMPDDKPTKGKTTKDTSADDQSTQAKAATTDTPQENVAVEGGGASGATTPPLSPLEQQLREREELERLRRELYRKYHGRPLA